jgi:hypothetical protein
MEIGNPHPTNQTHRRQPLPNKKNQKAAEEVPSLQGAARFFAPTSALNGFKNPGGNQQKKAPSPNRGSFGSVQQKPLRLLPGHPVKFTS